MIDHEFTIFSIIATALRSAVNPIYVAGEYVPQPPQFPCVFIVEVDNTVNMLTRDSGAIENSANVMYEVDVYSNKAKGKKAECKAIIALVDEQFSRLGFTRAFLNPIQNLNDATVYRMTARYRATIGKDNLVYRR